MSDRGWIQPIVERVVGETLNAHATQLRGEIVQRVMKEVAQQSSTADPASASSDLARAVADIQIGTSQKEILRSLLDSSSRYARRVALFVVKGTHASGWQARGFANCDAIKDFALDSSAQAVSRAITDHVSTAASPADFDPRFTSTFGAANGDAHLLPLVLKEKVAALLYADGGNDGDGLDVGALEVLVLATSSWLEVNTLRKQVHKDPASAPADGHRATAPESAPAFNDPFAAHTPAFAVGAASGGSHASGAAAAPAFATEIGEPTDHPQTGTSAVAAATAIANEDEEVQRKAQRFARLLVDEIKLYNQAKVAEGRKKKDLYDRLKEAIEKSRATYQKRYGNTVAASGNYFQHELVRSLAEDDLSIMGPNFRA